MKIAITSTGTEIDSPVDPRFGRAAYIIVVDPETLAFEVIDNQENASAFKGAGIQAATLVGDRGAKALLTGYCGPNAFKVLRAAKIKVAGNITGTVRDAVSAFNAGGITYADAANAESHW